MSDHRHHMIHGWMIGRKDLDWICTVTETCRAAWVVVAPHLWQQIER